MSHETIELATPDGPCTMELVSPEGTGPWPGVVLLHDGFGLREAFVRMATRVASLGYVVAVPDLFHRVGSVLKLAPPGVQEIRAFIPVMMGDPELRTRWRERFLSSATKPEHVASTLGAVLDSLAARGDVKPGGFGVSGYCLGGNVALRLAAQFASRIAAVASFHGGALATTEPDSPHLGVPAIRARVYVAGARDDSWFTEETKARLEQALTAAGVAHEIETYSAAHGFCVPDAPTYDAAAAERHYAALAALLGSTL
jgi:carboxymethylenebutenolidase